MEVGSALARRVTTGTPSELRELAGPALKLFLSVEKHFSDFVEDQFDFHTYCVRKMTLRAYVSVLKLEDNIRGHKAFVKACVQAAELYLLLHKADSAEVAKPQEAVDPKLAKALAKREKAKAAKAKRKAEADAKAQAEAAKEAAKNDDSKKKLPKRDADEDPKGEKLAALEPLKEATRLSKALEKYAAASVETHALAFDVSMVRDRPLLALRALRRLSKQGDQRAFVVRLARLTQARPAMTLTDTVARVLDAELKDLSGGDCVAFLRGFAERRPALRDRSATCRALHVLGVAEPSLVLQAGASNPDLAKPLPVRDFAEALAALQAVDATAAASFREECERRFPGADFLVV